MKVIQYIAFGGSEVLQLTDAEKPVIKDDEVLVKMSATTVNPLDIKIRSGKMQQVMPVELPFVPGSDIAGMVVAVGSSVERIKAGDHVFATTFGGTYAGYAAVKESYVALTPDNVSDTEAVALAVPVATSYTVLIERGNLKAGERVLIHGAGGGVGSVMVQMAKALGAYVAATASGAGVEMVKALGADEVIDYKKDDFTRIFKDIDLVADAIGGDTQAKSFEVMKKGGRLVSIFMPPSPELAAKFEVSAEFVSSDPSYKKLEFGKQMIEDGKITPRLARVLKLEQAAEAQDLLTAGGLNGKVVLTIG